MVQDRTDADGSPFRAALSLAKPCALHNGIREERPVTGKRHGWPHLAHLMSDVPEFAAFSRFRELNVKNLLYYQAELNIVQEQLAVHEEELTLDVKCYEDLAEDADSCYHRLMMKNRRLLREYSMSAAFPIIFVMLMFYRRGLTPIDQRLCFAEP